MINRGFSLRLVFVMLAVAAIASFLMSGVSNGGAWPYAVLIGLIWALLATLMFAGSYGVAWCVSRLLDSGADRRRIENPFATSAPPPQILRPSDPDT